MGEWGDTNDSFHDVPLDAAPARKPVGRRAGSGRGGGAAAEAAQLRRENEQLQARLRTVESVSINLSIGARTSATSKIASLGLIEIKR